MAAEEKRRIGVIGAGIVGVCTASWLQRDGHSVFLIDPGTPGEGASFGNAGGFNGSSVTPVAMPGVIRNVPKWLRDPLGPLSLRWSYLPSVLPYLARFIRAGTHEKIHQQARALRALISPTVPLIMDLAKAAGAEQRLHHRGNLYVYRTEESLAKDGLGWALRRENGVEVDELNADELRQLEPTLSRDYIRALYVRENAHTSDPFGLVTGLFDHFMRQGGEIVRASALGVRFDGFRLTAIQTDIGDLPADGAVVCAGAYSKPLAASLGERVPLETERGYHLVIQDPEVVPRIPVSDGEGKFATTPMEMGLRFAGTVELAGLKAPPDWRRARILLEQGRRIFPGLAKSHPEERISMWMGHRPSMPDSLPVLGPSRASPDVIYAFGHGHIGMTSAPMTGKIVADLLSGRPAPIDIAPFAASRF